MKGYEERVDYIVTKTTIGNIINLTHVNRKTDKIYQRSRGEVGIDGK